MKKLWIVFVSMRPWQWTKNFVLFAGVVFSERFNELILIRRSFYGFIIFCLASGAIYILNDVFDRKRDIEHPGKKNRPITSGLIGHGSATAISIVLMVLLLAVSWLLGTQFFWILFSFIALNIAYSIFLREVVILDVISISFSFLLRAVAGVAVLRVEAPDVELSPWLLICTLFLSLFLAFCKRRNELSVLDGAEGHRNALGEYTVLLLDQFVGLSATAALISYSIYTVWPETTSKFGTNNLVYTIPFVVFGIMRYLYLVYKRNEGGDPSGVLLMEKSILIDVFLWFLATMWILIEA